MKILLTGSHFTPAVAAIEEFKKIPEVDLIYVGRAKTMEGDNTPSRESKVLPALGVKFISLITGRLQRSFTLYTIPSLLKIPIGILQSIIIILSEKPDVILSFGGYTAVPIVFAGWLFSIPIITHEQTLVSGLAGRISNLFADKRALSFENPQVKNFVMVGNPIRTEILNPVKNLPTDLVKIFEYSQKEKLPVLLVMGGNQGSHLINTTVERILTKLIKIACVVHVSGDNKYGDFERLEGRESERYVVRKWIGEEIGMVLSKIDMAISRAGINSLSELAYMGVPTLVIPIPYLYQDEQNQNARFFQNLGFVKILPQSKLSGESLMKNVKDMLNSLSGFKQKAKEAKKVIIPDAAKRLALETILLVKNN